MVGTWAAWSTTGIALLALIVATIAGVATWKTNNAQQETLELQRQQLADTIQRNKRAQASKQTFWHDRETIYVSNASDSPIYTVTFYQLWPEVAALLMQGTILPAEPRKPFALKSPRELPHSSIHQVTMSFKDTDGVGWIRSTFGELREETAEDREKVVKLAFQALSQDQRDEMREQATQIIEQFTRDAEEKP